MTPAAFAIPGDPEALTGGYLYERRLLAGLRDLGHDMRYLRLPAGFPDPTPAEMAEAVDRLRSVGPARPLILDGLVSGAIDTAGLARVRAPIVAMVHHPLALESGLDTARRRHLWLTERDNLRLARHVLVPSPHTRRILIARYGVPSRRITVARPGVDPGRQPRAPADPPLILSVGILHPRKGHDVLLAALARITDLGWQAVIAGNPWDGAHALALRGLLRAHPAAGRITLAGRVTPEALQALYARASVFALATRYEGYGIAFNEALLNGLPIVSCDAGAVSETVPDAARLLVPPDDPVAFAGALRAVLGDAALRRRLEDAAIRAGHDLPGWEDTARIASAVLDRIATGG